jgi:hypothetical protein
VHLSLRNKQGFAVKLGILKSGDPLKVERNVITFDNVILGKRDSLIPYGNEFKFRISVGDIAVETNYFTVGYDS